MRFASERLREARLTLDLSQEEIAVSVGVDVRTWRRYESGAVNEGGFDIRNHSRQRLLDRICAELGLDPSDLLVEDAPLRRGPHVLPPARFFVGRAALLDRLAAWARDGGEPRVLALVAIGGAGKTSLAQRIGGEPFVWSFYQDPRVEALLGALLQRLDLPEGPAPTRAERLERALARTAPLLLVLDGLERLQADGSGERARGEIEDPSLRRLLYAIVDGIGPLRALVTSRLPLRDLEPWSGGAYEAIALPPLSDEEGALLLAAWGLRDAEALAPRIGGHALSLEMVGSYVSEQLGGDAARLPEIELEEARQHDRLARRLSAVLSAHAGALSGPERALLGALSVFPGGTSPATLAGLPLDLPPDAIGRAADRLVRAGLAHRDGERLGLHPFVAQFARTLLDDPARLHEAERIRLGAALGAERPEERDPSRLDRLEQLLLHTLGAGRPTEALALYQRALGGFSHLGLALGDLARGERCVRALARASLPAREAELVLYDRALYALALGDPPSALAALARAGSSAAARQERVVLAVALRTTAYTRRLTGDLGGAIEAIEASLAASAALGSPFHLVRGAALHAALLHDLGERDASRARFAEVRAMGDDPVARRGLWEAEHLMETGEPELARERTERNLAICEARGWPGHVAHCHAVLGALAARRGESAAARAHLAALDAWTERTGEVELVLRARLLAGELGDLGAAGVGAALAERLGYAPLGRCLRRLSGPAPRPAGDRR